MGGFIQASRDGSGFVDGRSERFVPFGCNYFDPQTGWAPKIWSRYDPVRVRRHLGQIAEAGLNCIRVFLDVGTLNPAPGQYSAEGFDKVDDLIVAAKGAGLRIIFSGPNTWEGLPEHRRGDWFADPRQIDHALALWERIARRWRGEPGVMTWDLLNEPMVGWPTRSEGWTGEHRLHRWRRRAADILGRGVCDDLPPPATAGQDRQCWGEYLRFQEDLAVEWVEQHCRTIRSAGAGQLISLGLIQWGIPILLPQKMGLSGFNPRRLAPHLSYLSAHFYPILRRPADGLEPELPIQRAYLEVVLRATRQDGKPLVLEEFGWKGGKLVPGDDRAWPEEHQTLWGRTLMAVSGSLACGWLNWAYADAADGRADISAASGLWTEDERIKDWGRRFSQFAAALKTARPAYRPADRRVEVDRVDFLFAHGGFPQLDWLAGQIADDPDQTIEVVFRD